MPVVGHSPSDGHRLELQREADDLHAPWRYRGTLEGTGTPAIELVVILDEPGNLTVVEPPALAPEHRERIARTLRSALRSARHDDPLAAPPRRLARWRSDDGR